jgi:hypothetical protein
MKIVFIGRSTSDSWTVIGHFVNAPKAGLSSFLNLFNVTFDDFCLDVVEN